MLKVNEIFKSIQGESSHAGFPCTFVRLTGCNLRCSYCDTRYAYDEGVELAIEDIMEKVSGHACTLVEITGGEPLLQEDTLPLISNLIDKGFRVLLETNGTLDISRVDPRCLRIVDVKLPASGEAEKNYLRNINMLHHGDELKFVVGIKKDYDYAKKIMQSIPEAIKDEIIVNFSPIFGIMEPGRLAGWILADCLPVRLNLQLHKVLWPHDMGGV